MQQYNFTIIKFTLCLVFGILIGYYFNVSLYTSVCICILLPLILGISFLINKKRTKKSIAFGILAFVTFFFIGILTTTFHNQENHLNHYSNHFNNELDSNILITFKVREVLKSGNYYNKYVIDLKRINDEKVSGKSLLNVQKDSVETLLNVDDVIITKTAIKELISPLNPHQFDYKAYLKKQHIYNQLFVKKNELLILNREKTSIFGFASKLRELINSKLKKYDFEDTELAIINALLLGQRQDISKEIYNSYTQAGAIHILAVSGLHVGIILLILNFIFKPIERLKQGKFIKTLLILLLLWCFAIVAGLSASVTRAVTMFSIVAIGMNLKRPTNIYNTLTISMFILLLFKPTFLFDVGFQLSYLAVFSIVWIQPMLYKKWSPKWKIIDKFWQIFTVTIAAQFGIVPVSLYYFHQFPGLFFISNLVIIPFLGFILGFGILVIALALLNILPQFLALAYGTVISWMNEFVSFISRQEYFLYKYISFDILLVIASYILIISFVRSYQKLTYNRVIFALSSMSIFISVLIFNNYDTSSNEFIIFHKSRFSLVGIKQNTNLVIHHNMDSVNLNHDKTIINYRVGSYAETIRYDTIKPIYKLNQKLVLVVDSLGIYKTSFKPNYVVLRNSPKINLDRLIDKINPELIIADGSNYKSYQERWLKTCLKKGLPFHQAGKKGAFIVKYE